MKNAEIREARRRFLAAGAAAVAAGSLLSVGSLRAQKAGNPAPANKPEADKKPASDPTCKHVILVYANGGPSQFETFDPKPGQKTGAPFKIIKTEVPGFTPVEHLPRIAALATELCLIRNMRSDTVDHAHARHLMHTGWLSNPTISRPGLGNIVSHQLGGGGSDLPGFVKFGGPGASAGYLGAEHNAFIVKKAGEKLDNLERAPGVDKERAARRARLVREMDADFAEVHGDKATTERRISFERARRLMESPLRSTFYLDDEPDSVWQDYGGTEFARSCVAARRLVEKGVPAVEIHLDGWDTHDDAFKRNVANCETLDRPFAALIKDLKSRGLLESTLVAWYGDFGRTPKLTATSGRGHSSSNFCVLLAGGGVRGGQVIGETNEDGTELVGGFHSPRDLFATFGQLMSWKTEQQFQAGTRPTFLVEKEAHPIKAVYEKA